MLGIGIGEMILIAGIALIVIGPEKFPDFAKIALRTARDLRGYVDEIQNEISKEIKPIKRELNQLNKYDPEKYIDALTKNDAKSTATADTGAKAAASKGAADPTDRQDDSFDYDVPETGKHPDEDPYGNENMTGGAGNTNVFPPDKEKPSESQPAQAPEDAEQTPEESA